MANVPIPGLEPEMDSISIAEGLGTDRVSAGDWNPDDAIRFAEEVLMPNRAGLQDDGEATEPLMSRASTLASMLEGQRNTAERLLARSGRTSDPRVQEKVARHISEMNRHHELAFKLIGKLQQSIETVTKLQ